jgi:phosphatidylserine/phosphatidylglycerophosphate/cardiolipin synthase-like enzyme
MQSLAPGAALVGGTQLLGEFMARCSSSKGQADLYVVAPFISESGAARLLASLAEHRSSTVAAKVVTRDVRAAEAFLTAMERSRLRDVQIHLLPRLHAKFYVFDGRQGPVHLLIGSHNLTQGGVSANIEAGVLLSGDGRAGMQSVRSVVDGSIAQFNRLQREASLYYDSASWPSRKPSLRDK